MWGDIYFSSKPNEGLEVKCLLFYIRDTDLNGGIIFIVVVNLKGA